MLRSTVGKVVWVGRATVILVGLAVILALLFGVASTAFAHKGDKGFFHLAHRNVAQKVSILVRQGAGPALNLRVESGPPLKVNSATKVPNLNVDQLDGQDSSEFLGIGANAGGALTGTYPDPGIADDAVGINNLQNNAVNTAKIADASVSSTKIQNGQVKDLDLANGAVNSAKIDNTQIQQRVSDSCPSGSSIQSIAPTGGVTCQTTGFTDREVVENSTGFNDAQLKTAIAICPEGKIAISGGGRYSSHPTGQTRSGAHDIALQGSWPLPRNIRPDQWLADADWVGEGNPPEWRLIAYAICVNQ